MNQDFLLKQFVKEDKTVYSQIYKKYVNLLYNYGISLNFSHDMCMDAIHDVFYKLYTGKKDLEDIDNIKYYLLRSLKNRLLDIYRHNKGMQYEDVSELPFSIGVTVVDFIIDREEQEQLKKKVETLLASLTDRQREAIYLRYMQDLEYDEIGQLLNITPESVRKLVYRGFEEIRQNTGGEQLIALIGILVLMKDSLL